MDPGELDLKDRFVFWRHKRAGEGKAMPGGESSAGTDSEAQKSLMHFAQF